MCKKAVMMLLLLVLLISESVFGAENVLNQDRDSKIYVDLQTDKLEGAQLSVYQIGEMTSNENSISFHLTKDFKDSEVDLDKLMFCTNSEKEQTADKLREFLKEEEEINPLQIIEIDKDGKTETAVKAGMYLICQFEDTEDFEIQPVIAAVPTVNETLDEWEYETTLKPKFVLHSDAPDTGDLKLVSQRVQILGAMCIVLSVFILTVVYIWRARKVRK